MSWSSHVDEVEDGDTVRIESEPVKFPDDAPMHDVDVDEMDGVDVVADVDEVDEEPDDDDVDIFARLTPREGEGEDELVVAFGTERAGDVAAIEEPDDPDTDVWYGLVYSRDGRARGAVSEFVIAGE